MGLLDWLFGKRDASGQTAYPPKKGTDIKFRDKEVKNGNTYEVYTATCRSKALDFLRATEVKEERKYVIVETPEGSFGKDLIMIFDEATSEKVEFGVRHPLPKLKKSITHCTKCGYPVLPAGSWPAGMNVKELILLEQMKEKGVGLYCSNCQTSWCPFCVSAVTCDLCGRQLALCRE